MGFAGVILRRKKLFTIFAAVTGLWLLYLCFVYKDHGLYPAVVQLASVQSLGSLFFNTNISIGSVTDIDTVARLRVHPHVNIFNASKESLQLQLKAAKHSCVRFRTPITMSMICVYPAKQDIYVSGDLIRGGMWESELVQLTRAFMLRNPGMSLLDVGCNIGTFTIFVAQMGHKVVAVDANKMNLMLLSRSLEINELHQNVTIVWNALSDVREDVTLNSKKEPMNIGGWHVQPANDTENENVIKAVYLDDLAYVFGNETVFMKMDIEQSEMKALAGGKQFFDSVNVTHLLMEFFQHRKSASGKQIVDFLSERGCHAFTPRVSSRVPLDNANYTKWPNNVLWIKQ